MFWQRSNKNEIDYNAAGRDLWAKLNLDPGTKPNMYNQYDAIWRHPTGGGFIYVGNENAARDLELLRSIGVTRVVNCTHGFSRLPNYHEGSLAYYTFPISGWESSVKPTDDAILAFTDPMFKFIEDAVSSGDSVLVHCLAGAHRAGTTGCACLVHFANLDDATAIRTAKSLRPIIDPIGNLPFFLQRLHKARVNSGRNQAN